jgi:hypothetical protein
MLEQVAEPRSFRVQKIAELIRAQMENVDALFGESLAHFGQR